MNIRKRTWTTPTGDTRESWQADYIDDAGRRKRKQFTHKKEAEAFLRGTGRPAVEGATRVAMQRLVVLQPKNGPKDFDRADLPEALRLLDHLEDITGDYARCGIYFLCRGGALVYIGQSVNVVGRVYHHMMTKEFDRVFFLPWRKEGLNDIEGSLIRALRPVLNGSPGPSEPLVPDSELAAVVAAVRGIEHNGMPARREAPAS